MIIKEDDPKFYDFEPSPTSQGREEMSREETLDEIEKILRDTRKEEYSADNGLTVHWVFSEQAKRLHDYFNQRTEKMREELERVKKELEHYKTSPICPFCHKYYKGLTDTITPLCQCPQHKQI